MSLCFFSLASTMTANLLNHTHELAVLRAVGFTSTSLIKVYTLEAFILVISSAILGLVTGTLLSYTMVS